MFLFLISDIEYMSKRPDTIFHKFQNIILFSERNILDLYLLKFIKQISFYYGVQLISFLAQHYYFLLIFPHLSNTKTIYQDTHSYTSN